jgi:hypothetical protein
MFSKTFKINSVKKDFDNVSRIISSESPILSNSENYADLEIDVHDTFFDFYNDDGSDFVNKEFELELVMNEHGISMSNQINEHDYSMHGTIFKVNDNSIHVSFGGLLMKLTGIKLESELIDKNMYCLINVV